MATLLQSIEQLIDNVSITDRQEENIKNSVSNLDSHLRKEGNNLFVESTFTNGSYERDTIIRPLNDVDIFAVLSKEDWKDEYDNLPNPQSVLTRIKNYLNGLDDYKDKVSQSRPCVTIKLSDKDFDVLPSFAQIGGGYLIPNSDLKSWTYSYPEQLTSDLYETHKKCNYKLKQVVRAIKYWNRENSKIIPSYHVEETAINIFKINSFTNYEEAIRLWFNNAEYYLVSQKFKSNDDYNAIVNKIKKVKDKLNDAKKLRDENKGSDAIKIWKEIFGKEFPTVDLDEAKNFAKSLSEGSLRVGSTGVLSTTIGKTVSASKGFYGDDI